MMDEIRCRLVELREKAKKKQIGGGAYGRVSQSTISTWEAKPPKQLLTLRKLVLRYNTNANYLLMLTDDPRPLGDLEKQLTISIEDPDERDRLKEAIEILEEASSDEREYILGLIRRLAPKPPRIIGEE